MPPDRRPDRDLWLWLGTGLFTAGFGLGGIEAAFTAGNTKFNFWTSGQLIASYALIVGALACFLAAVREAPFPFAGRKAHPDRSTDAGDTGATAKPEAQPPPSHRSRGPEMARTRPMGAIEIITPRTIEAELDALVEVAALGFLAQDTEITESTMRRWAGSAEITIRTRCAPAWAARFAAAGYGQSPREELTAKIEFIHDKLMAKVRTGWFDGQVV